MARIKNTIAYVFDNVPEASSFLVGSDEGDGRITKSYRIDTIFGLLPSYGYFTDAPADGQPYIRQDNAWAMVTPSGVGSVFSVFGRTGAVTGQVGDYNAFYSLLGHTHTEAQITDLQAYLLPTDIGLSVQAHSAALDLVSGTNTGDQTSIVGISGTKAQYNLALSDGSFMFTGDAPTAHTHTEAQITDLQAYLLPTSIDTLLKLNTIVADATLIDTTDSRLSDARTPLSHTHLEADITDLQAYLTSVNISDINTTGVASAGTWLRGDGVWGTILAGVSSVFGRTADILALETDYNAFYLTLDQTAPQTIINGAPNFSAGLEADFIDVSTAPPAPSWKEGRIFYDDINKCITSYDDIVGTSLQNGQEVRIRVFNNTGSIIVNGSAVTIVGITLDDVVQIELAISSDKTSSLNTIGIATHDIGIGEYGWATTTGSVGDVDTSAYTEGSAIYLSETVAGAYQLTRPPSPSYEVRMGGVLKQNATTGKLFAETRIITNDHDNNKFYNGTILEDHTVTITTTPTVTTLNVIESGSRGYLSIILNQEYVKVVDPINIILTNGTDTVPITNFIYFNNVAVITVSTSGFPTAQQYVPIATANVQSAASVNTYGVYKLHAWTNELSSSTGQGHLSHVNKWIRNRPATWESGVVLTTTIGSALPTIPIAYSSGSVYQLHPHVFPAFNTATGSSLYEINNPTTPYIRRTSISPAIDTDSLGNAIGNNKYYKLVIWGVSSESESQSKLMLNLPSGSYTNVADALTDIDKTANFTIPIEYLGTGFLITSMIIQRGTTNVEIITGSVEDLRGSFPATGAGGGTIGGAGITAWTELSDTPVSITADGVVVGNGAGSALEFVSLGTDLQSAFDGKLNLTGGTLTGTLNLPNLNVSNVATFTGSNPIRIYGTSTGATNTGYMSIYESNGTVRQGYFGFPSTGNANMYMSSDVAGTQLLLEQAGGVNGLKYYDGVGTSTVWHSRNDGAGSGLDADTLRTFAPTTAATSNTVALRDSNGYLFSTYFNGSSSFSTSGASTGMANIIGTNGTDTFARSYSKIGLIALLNTGSGLDADLLDGLQRQEYTLSRSAPHTDFNSFTTASELTSVNTASNTPFGSAWYTLYNARHRGGSGDGNVWGSQIAVGMTNYQDRVSFRTQSSGTWSSWTEMLHSGARNQSKTGSLTASNFILSSDKRYKKGIKYLNDSEKVRGLFKWAKYQYKNNAGIRYGAIANDVELTNPELVVRDDEGMRSLGYFDLFSLDAAHKDKRITELEDTVEELRAKIELIIKELL